MERNALNGAKTGDACGHPLTNHAERKGIGNSRGLWRAFWVAALALGLYLVPSPALCDTPAGAKGIYAYGYPHYFQLYNKYDANLGQLLLGSKKVFYGRTSFSGLGSSDVKHHFDLGWLAFGSLGVCAFNGKLYCFFMTDSALSLQYVTVTPSDIAEYQYDGPFGVATATNLSTGDVFGVAAAVMDGTLYVFTPGRTFSSKDGEYFRSVSPGPEFLPVEILDAVTFYPPKHDEDDAADPGIMVVYDRANPKSAVFRPASNTSWSNRQDLPEPSEDIQNGNLVLGTAYSRSDDPCYSSENPALQFYAALDQSTVARCQYDLKERTWTTCTTVEKDWKKSKNHPYMALNQIAVMPAAVETPAVGDDNQKIHMYHLLKFWLTGKHADTAWEPNYQSDILEATDHKTVSTASAGANDTLRNLWSLVGVVHGPPPFSYNGTGVGDTISEVSYGIENSATITTAVSSTNISTIAVGTEVKAGLGGVSLDVSYSHAVAKSNENSSTVTTDNQYDFGPVSEGSGPYGTHGWCLYFAPTLATQKYEVHSWRGGRS